MEISTVITSLGLLFVAALVLAEGCDMNALMECQPEMKKNEAAAQKSFKESCEFMKMGIACMAHVEDCNNEISNAMVPALAGMRKQYKNFCSGVGSESGSGSSSENKSDGKDGGENSAVGTQASAFILSALVALPVALRLM